jgi:integrase
MYLFRAPNCTYYTRICLPKYLRDRGFPFDLKISLLSKYRAEAVSRNATVTLVIKKVLELVTNDTTPEIFKREVNREVNDVRLSFSSPEHNNVPTRDVGLAKLEKPQESVSKGILLSDALDGFIQSKSKESIRALTVWQLKQRTAHFINATSSQYVSDITSASALKYRDVLLEEDRSVKSNKEYLAAVSQFFKWCCIMEYTGANLFVNIRLNQKKENSDDSSRQRWQKDELETLVNSTKYHNTDDHFKFATLLMLYHGLRPSEACQLTLKDIASKDNHICLNITDTGAGQRLKTLASKRVVPVHPLLIKAGFVAFVDDRARQRAKQLFNYLPTNQNEDWSRQYCQQLGRLQTTLCMNSGDRPTAYSFRHSFIDEMKQQEIDESIVAQIVGHETKNITFSRYGKKYPISLLVKKLKRVKYDIETQITCTI